MNIFEILCKTLDVLDRILDNEWVEAFIVSTIVLLILMYMGIRMPTGSGIIILLLYVCTSYLRKIKEMVR